MPPSKGDDPLQPPPRAQEHTGARVLPFGLTEEILAAAMAEPDPGALAAGTAAVAAANLTGFGAAEVVCADVAEVAAGLLTPGVAAFCDPARRDPRGRVWRVTDFTPPWALVTGLLDGRRPAGGQLGPALPHDLVPPGAEAEWLTDRGDTVEVSLWAGAGSVPGRRSALVRADGQWHRL